MNSKLEKIDIRQTIAHSSDRFFDQFRLFIRKRGLAYATEKTYCSLVHRFIKYNLYESSSQMEVAHIEVFLSHLANDNFCSPNTQRTALNSLVFLFREYLGRNTDSLQFNLSKAKPKVPTVLSREEAKLIIKHLTGIPKLATQLMFGCGLRVNEVAHPSKPLKFIPMLLVCMNVAW